MAKSLSEEHPRKKRKRKVKKKSIWGEILIVFAGLPILIAWISFRTFVCWGNLSYTGEVFCTISGTINPLLLVLTLVLIVLTFVDLHKLGDELEELPKWSSKRIYKGFRSLEKWDKFHFLFSFVSFLGALIIGIYLLNRLEFSLF
ncbi:hypothetical protein [Leptospira mayottensis]|uniref:Uncharacterized protein n=2 Tax=Leptospira mayottensis TaxID=1137606 RepID=A0AA87MQ60_9LEPT|nr:hypothetical protein [Leptospira mayottensis]AXR59737.1 hypothetical protein DQM68_02415 [Leptospira mayottensis]AXR64015.1 hypothetical protein DQM28_07040 [Leptospira mayottensis]AZQ00943.1 hypothetical protein LEP1GSC190_01560 [Leptospira mayottensis 200901116]EKS00593.1 hypothetical protein LEP1GSC125_2733 [Leptospira mayottensis 200901122]TGN11833.1 hypothetical protein EHR03_06370 [Leptospira mayottensis]